MYVNSAHTAANGDLMARGPLLEGGVSPTHLSFYFISYFQHRFSWAKNRANFDSLETAFPVTETQFEKHLKVVQKYTFLTSDFNY